MAFGLSNADVRYAETFNRIVFERTTRGFALIPIPASQQDNRTQQPLLLMANVAYALSKQARRAHISRAHSRNKVEANVELLRVKIKAGPLLQFVVDVSHYSGHVPIFRLGGQISPEYTSAKRRTVVPDITWKFQHV